MNALSKLAVAAAITLSSASLALAESAHHGAHSAPASTQPAGVAGQTVEGEIRKVDKEAGKITIKHGELKNLDMPPMTMVFRVKDPAMLDQVKAGDKVSFVADKIGGQYTVVKLELAK